MNQIKPDTAFTNWTVAELRGMYRARVRRLLLLEQDKAPKALTQRQEAMVKQSRRLLHNRGIEL